MPARIKSKANPEVLKWARKNARLSLEDAARRAGVTSEALGEWENGADAPSIPQLRKLGEIYRRPIVVFYLPHPPLGFDPLRDFRRLATGTPEESPELAGEIRWAHEMREAALEAFRSIGVEFHQWTLVATTSEAVEDVGARITDALGVTRKNREDWKSAYEAYGGWRAAIERLGALCFQVTGIDVDEARGFSIGLHPCPVIAVNAADAPTARIFTLLHELTHISLGAAGKCDLHERDRGQASRDSVEVYCNAVAAEVLVPAAQFRAEPSLRGVRAPRAWDDEVVAEFANKYRVSREVILRRLLQLGFATGDFYRTKRDELKQEKDKPGGGNYYNNMRTKLGVPLIQGVLDAWNLGKLTANEAAGYLRVKVESLSRLLVT